MTATLDDEVADLRRANAELQRRLDEAFEERDEALERETATAEVLGVINASPGDLGPVFDAMLEKGVRLSESACGVLCTLDGERFETVAMHGLPAAYADYLERNPLTFAPESGPTRVLAGLPFHTLPDFTVDELTLSGDPNRRALVELGGARTGLTVPLRKDAALIGMFLVFRQEVRPFSDKQIALLQNFAAQAVIAMENARLLGELQQRTGDLQESLEYQTATSDVLKVISGSTFDIQPVFDTLAETAARLCDAGYTAIYRRDGEAYRMAAVVAFSPETMEAALKFQAVLEQHPLVPGRGSIVGRVALEGRAVHVADTASDPEYIVGVARTLGNMRTVLGVPLLREGEPIGVIILARHRVQPFTDRQIELVRTFADQAVIAMENARLITETREALDQQTATAEVLQVINASPGDIAPVFEAILEKATRLCEAPRGQLATFDGELFCFVAVHGEPGIAEGNFALGATRPEIGVTWPRIVRGESIAHIVDVMDTDLYRAGHEGARRFVDVGGGRTLLTVALRKDDVLLGTLTVYRQEVRPFSDKQIALLQNLAAQAVIAMENARLIAETREALEQQTATAEVLGVINSSPGDLAPVFDAILDKAHSLCNASSGALILIEEDRFRPIAIHGEPAFREYWLSKGWLPFSTEEVPTRLKRGEVAHVLDAATATWSGETRSLIELAAVRSLLLVPLLKDGVLAGAITAFRNEPEPFTDKQIALLENFAAQAVIAMENARLITETREALEQQTATAEVLGVINSSPGDIIPVFDAMLEKAMRLCEAAFGALWTYDGESFHAVSVNNTPAALTEFVGQPYSPGPRSQTPLSRVLQTKKIARITDLATDEMYLSGDRWTAAPVELGGARSYLAVPLLKDGTLVGAFTVSRLEVRPFSDKQTTLVENFAAQAVIAMENARLITETREALEQQTATAEVLQVINSSPGDLAPVFGAMLDKAVRLCEATYGTMFTQDGDRFRAVALRDVPEKLAEFLQRESLPMGPNTFIGRVMRTRSPLHIADGTAEEPYRQRLPIAVAGVELGGSRTMLTVPLLKDDALLGIFQLVRQEVRPFSDKQIALVENFAVQAVIAMENTRLITETREALDQQTATTEVLEVINSSPGNLAPVFEAMLDKAMRLCEATCGHLYTFDGDCFNPVVMRGDATFAEWWHQHGPVRPVPGAAFLGRVILGEHVVSISDALSDEAYLTVPAFRQLVDTSGIRSGVGVALRSDDAVLGAITIYRQEVRPFTDRQVALLQNFAAQAVIAMENARLITETREALDQQTATAEILGVINSSPGDLAPVFDAVIASSIRLCRADHAGIYRNEGGEYRWAGGHAPSSDYEANERTIVITPGTGSLVGRAALEGRVVQIADAWDDPLYDAKDDARSGGVHTMLGVPLLRDGVPIGVIGLARKRVELFSDREITLVENFAAQAVVAVENARLITETREALDQQTATAEVLQVINSSPGDLAPVFDVMLEKALQLCEAAHGVIRTYDGQLFHEVARRDEADVVDRLREFSGQGRGSGPIQPGPNHPFERLVQGERVVHIADLATEAGRVDAANRERIAVTGARTWLAIALQKEGMLLGTIIVHRREIRPFSNKQIALLQNFAAQAVIAMENARLITETREALDQQTATAEVLGVINSSPGDLAPVFDTILEKAHLLCSAAVGALFLYDGEKVRAAAVHGYPEDVAETLRNGIRPPPPLLDGARMIHRHDVREDADPVGRLISQRGGVRTNLLIPLRKDGVFLGMISCNRQEVRPYSDKEISLIENFATQAVIAIENARLLDEIRQRQAELRTTFDNMADGVVMFDEDRRLAAWNRNFQELLDLPDALLANRPSYADYLRLLAERGEFGTDDIEAELSRRLAETDQELRLERTRPDGRVIEVRRNAVPDGGFVLIYSDITERKRSEAEIRAARDAAEATLRELRAAQANLIQAEKMASLGQLTAGIAHEIKNPLNFVNNFADLSGELLKELQESAAPAWAALDDDKRAEIDETMVLLTGNLEKIAEHGHRADNIVKSMLEHSRGVSGERREVDLNSLIEEALNLAYHGARAQDQGFNITLERGFDKVLAPMEVAPQEITRVFLNLFGNSFYAANKRAHSNGDASFRPTLTVSTRDLGEVVEVKVRDNGTGIPPEIRDKLFQPFFTTKPTGEGTGLGLSISYDIVTQQHGGTITVESEPGEFTEFIVRLPRAHRARTAGAASWA